MEFINNPFITIFLYCVIFTCIPIIIFNSYKIIEKYCLKLSREEDAKFLEIFNDFKNKIIKSNEQIILLKNWNFLSVFCACEKNDNKIIIHINNYIKKDLNLYKCVLAHELFHAKDLIENKKYNSSFEKEKEADLRAAKLIGTDTYIKSLLWLSKRWFLREGGTSHPKWKERIDYIKENSSLIEQNLNI